MRWRGVVYAIAAAVMLMLIPYSGWDAGIAVVLFGLAWVAGRRLDHRYLFELLFLDLAVASGIWWIFGPVAGVIVVTFAALAVGAILLERRRARWLVGGAVATVGLQVSLHLVDTAVSLPLFHPASAVPNSEFLIGSLLEGALLAAFGVLLLNLGEMLYQGQEALEADRDRQLELNHLKDRFVATVSHELRTPLTALRGFTKMLLDTDPGPAERKEFLGIMDSQAEELASLIEDLITFSRIEAGKLQTYPEELMVHDEVERVLTGFGERAQAVENLVPVRLGLDFDPIRFRQVLRNLVDNALEYGRSPVQIRARLNSGHVVCEVWDAGDGVDTSQRDTVFEPYQRLIDDVTMSKPGIGLGLPLVRQLVEAHGGRVEAVEEGAMKGFRIVVPHHGRRNAPGIPAFALPE